MNLAFNFSVWANETMKEIMGNKWDNEKRPTRYIKTHYQEILKKFRAKVKEIGLSGSESHKLLSPVSATNFKNSKTQWQELFFDQLVGEVITDYILEVYDDNWEDDNYHHLRFVKEFITKTIKSYSCLTRVQVSSEDGTTAIYQVIEFNQILRGTTGYEKLYNRKVEIRIE